MQISPDTGSSKGESGKPCVPNASKKMKRPIIILGDALTMSWRGLIFSRKKSTSLRSIVDANSINLLGKYLKLTNRLDEFTEEKPKKTRLA